MTPALALAAFSRADRRHKAALDRMRDAEIALRDARDAFQRADHDRNAATYAAHDAYRLAEHAAGRDVTADTNNPDLTEETAP